MNRFQTIVRDSIIIFLVMCCTKKNTPNGRLEELNKIISRWELTLQYKTPNFNNLVQIQGEVTAYDFDINLFEQKYGYINSAQIEKIDQLRLRFKQLMAGKNVNEK